MKTAAILLASFVTLAACIMAGVAAWDRGGNWLDRSLLASISVIIVLSVHLLPSMSKRWVGWVVWAGCLLCAIYGHLTFLVHSNERALQQFSENSSLSVGTEKQIVATKAALSEIQARPMSVVASELADAKERRVRAALNIELEQSKRAQQLRDELRKLEAASTESKVKGEVDPVTQKLAETIGVSESSISVVMGLTISLLVELIGSVLWFEVLRGNSGKVTVAPIECITQEPVTRPARVSATSHVTQKVVTPVTSSKSSATPASVTPAISTVTEVESNESDLPKSNDSVSQLEMLKNAISEGRAKATVSGIREFLGCGQNRAIELRRALQI